MLKKLLRRSQGVILLGLCVAGCNAAAPAPLVRPVPAPALPVAIAEPPPYIPWGEHTVATRLDQFGDAARDRWQPWFEDAGVTYPGNVVVLVGLKNERRLQVYAGPTYRHLTFVRDFAWTATSGGPGPKLREGDRQIPEGVYEIEALNPNSRFHVSLRVGYPNEADRSIAAREGRTRLGGDIMIHGGDRSVGCIAVGDEAAEDLFVLAADIGLENLELVLAPRDFRRSADKSPRVGQPSWVRNLYAHLDATLRDLPSATITTAGRADDTTQIDWILP